MLVTGDLLVWLETHLSRVCRTSVDPTISKVLWGTAANMSSLRTVFHPGKGYNMSGVRGSKLMVRHTLESLSEVSYASLDSLAATMNNNIQGLGHTSAGKWDPRGGR